MIFAAVVSVIPLLTPAAQTNHARGLEIWSEPMLDGACDEYRGRAMPLGQGVTMHIRQTREFVWLCFRLPERSFGSADLAVETPLLPEATNLHASAQLGEWPINGSQKAQFGNNVGWIANTNHFTGMGKAGRPTFARLKGREFQIGKARFGTGGWRLHLMLDGLGGPAKGEASFRFPTQKGRPWFLEVR